MSEGVEPLSAAFRQYVLINDCLSLSLTLWGRFFHDAQLPSLCESVDPRWWNVSPPQSESSSLLLCLAPILDSYHIFPFRSPDVLAHLPRVKLTLKLFLTTVWVSLVTSNLTQDGLVVEQTSGRD